MKHGLLDGCYFHEYLLKLGRQSIPIILQSDLKNSDYFDLSRKGTEIY